MNLDRARECLVAAKRDPVVAAWICVLDEYDLPPNTPIAPEDFWGTFEQFYCQDLIDDDQYYNDETAEKIRAGRKSIKPVQIHDALGRLTALRVPKGSAMPKPSDLFAAQDDSQSLARRATELTHQALERGHQVHSSGMSLFAENTSAPALFGESAPVSLFDDKRPLSLELGQVMSSPSALACTNMEEQPFDVQLDIQITCKCSGISRPITIVREDANGILDSAEFVPAADSGEENDVAEFVFHGRCDLCNTTVCATSIKPVVRGRMGSAR